MKNLTAAIFLTLLFCTVSASGEETAEGFNQNPEYSIPSPAGETPEAAKPVQSAEKDQVKSAKKTEPHDREMDETVQNSSGRSDRPAARFRRNSSGRKTVRTEYNDESRYAGERDRDLKDWENSNSPVPSSLPRVTNFRPRTHSDYYSRNYRNYKNYYWSDSYYYRSSSPRIRTYNRNGRTIIRVKSHR